MHGVFSILPWLFKSVILKCAEYALAYVLKHLPLVLVYKLAPVYIGQGETEETDHFRSVHGSFNKQGNLYMRLVLGGEKMNRCLYRPGRSSKCVLRS